MTTALGTGLRRAAARLAPDPDPAPDGELLARFLATRDEAAFALLVRRHGPMVLGTCRRVLRNAADADDAFQAAFVVLVREAHSLTARTCVGNFLYGVAFHTALKARAMATKRRAKEAKATRERDRPESDELTRALDEELANLPDKYREPVVLCALEGVSRKAAAARLGIPEGTVSSRLATAHRMLAKRLTAKGFASVAVAVLANQASAVPDTLADAALRAAIDGPPAAVSQLASEVSKMLLWNKLKAGTVLASVLLACGLGFGLTAKAFAADDKPAVKAPAPKKEVPNSDEELIQGSWEAATVQVGGKQVPAGDVYKVLKMRFKGRVVTTITEDGEAEQAFALETSNSPKRVATHPEGKPGEKKVHFIYDLDGDTLKLCHNTLEGDAGPLPTTFRAGPQDNDELIVFKRVKEPKAKPPADDKSYSLKGGEVLKLIPAPFADEREGVYTKFDAAGGIKPTPPHDTFLMAVTVKDGKPVSASAFANRKTPGVEAPGKPLSLFVQYALRTDMTKVSDPDWLLETTALDADVVLKKGADPTELVATLEKELSVKCGVKLSLKFEEVEREVVVISGKHPLNPPPKESDDGRVFGQASVVHFYATDKVEHPNSLMDHSRGLSGELAKFVGRPVIDESDLIKNSVPVKMTFHLRHPESDVTRAADRDVKKVLQNLANQTGLVFKLGKQKVKVLVVAKAAE